MEKLRVGVIGLGAVGIRLIRRLGGGRTTDKRHPWFKLTAIASANDRLIGQNYGDVMDYYVQPRELGMLRIQDALTDIDKIAEQADLVICDTGLPIIKTRVLEEEFAKREVVVISNDSANRWEPDVPLLIPEVNAGHLQVLPTQRRRLGTQYGCIVAMPSLSAKLYAAAIHPLREFGPVKLSVCICQNVPNAGKTLASREKELPDNIAPLPNDDDDVQNQPQKIWGCVKGNKIAASKGTIISAQCFHVPVPDGCLAAIAVQLRDYPDKDQILSHWAGLPNLPNLPSSPAQFLQYRDEIGRSQTRLDHDVENGMAISLGCLRPDKIWSWKFHALAYNTVHAEAGSCILTAELLVDQGLVPNKQRS